MDRRNEIVKVSVVGIIANLVLVAFKAAVGLISGSIAVILDAVNNLSDALSSVITIVGTKLAGKAPDKKHPYGYGRIENISSVTIAVIVLLAGLTSFKESVEKILHPEEASYTAVSLIIIAAAVVVKLLLGRYVKGKGEKLNSDSLIASGSDALFDAAISVSTLVAAAVSLIWHVSIEGWLGAIIAVVIVKSGVEILLESLGAIIGQRVDSELSVRLKEYVSGFYEQFGIVLTVGIYAANTADGESGAIREKLTAIAGEYPEFRQLHGFYAEPEKKHVSFDAVLDFGCDAARIREEILAKLRALYPDYTFDMVLDSDFSD